MAKTAKASTQELSVIQRQQMEQRQIAANSLPDGEKHLALGELEPAPILEFVEHAGDRFGKNDNNRRMYARLVAQKGSAAGDRVKGNNSGTANDPDAEAADPVNPTFGEKAHDETDVHIATLTKSAVIDNKPVTTVRPPSATGGKLADKAVAATGPETPAQAEAAANANQGSNVAVAGTPWQNNG